MNKNRFKVIFNPKRGQMVAVQECAAREGKSTADTQMAQAPIQLATVAATAHIEGMLPCAHHARSAAMAMRWVSFCLKLAFGSAAIATATGSFAQGIQADKNAPGNQQPTIMQSANGTPQVNIQTPSGAGVSMNQYQQMDVGEQGAILNNSRKEAPTHIGGWVQGNPWLAGGEAKIIVNQVNSGNPSALNGYIEVAGRKAEVIIANPAGLNINGAGFINASGVQLSTGKVMMEGGSFNGLEVRSGAITVEGQGLDARGADYTRLLSQAATINAGIWANDLQVIAGSNNIDAQGGHSAVDNAATNGSADPAAKAPPAVAIDTAHLGGMYAGKITLVSSDKGVGVNNAGQIFAAAGGIQIDANGQLTNSGAIIAADKTQADSGKAHMHLQAESLHNSGTVSSQGKSEYTTQSLSNTGLIASADELVLRNQTNLSNSGAINAGRLDITTAALRNEAGGKIEQIGSQALVVSAQQLDNTHGARIGAPEKTSSQAPQSGASAEKDGEKNAEAGASDQGQASPAPSTATGAGKLESSQQQAPRTFAAGQIVVDQSLRNDNAQINATGEIDVKTSQALNNQAVINVQSLDAQGDRLANNAGQLQAQTIKVNTLTLENRAGSMAAQEVQLQANSLDNQHGSVQANQAEITAQSMDNQQGRMVAQSLQLVALQTLDNQGGELLGDSVKVTATQWDNRSGQLLANEEINATIAADLNNQHGTIRSGKNLQLHDGGKASLHLDNTAEGTIEAGQDLRIQAKSLAHTGSLVAGHNAHIQVADSLTLATAISAGGDLAIATAGDLHNSTTLSANKALLLSGANIENTVQGTLKAGEATSLIAEQSIVNRGLINSNGHTSVVAGQRITNVGTGRIYGDHVSLGAKELVNDSETLNGQKASAVVAARERLDIGAQHILNHDNALLSTEKTLGIGGVLTQDGRATGMADTFINAGARLEAQGKSDIAVRNLQNLNTNLVIEEYRASEPQRIEQFAAPGQTKRWTQGEGGTFDQHRKNIEFKFDDFNEKYSLSAVTGASKWDLTRTIYRQRVLESQAGEIYIGGDLTASGEHWLNKDSQLVVGGELLGSIDGLIKNEETQGTQRIEDVGDKYTYYYKKSRTSHNRVKTQWSGSVNESTISHYDFDNTPFKFETNAQANPEQKQASRGDAHKADVDSGAVSVGPVDWGQSGLAEKLQTHFMRLAGNSLYQINADRGSYLVETDPSFTNHKQWLGSDYMLSQWGQDPQDRQKRLGDGYYEQRIVNEQVVALTGYRRLEGYDNDEDQFMALMNSGLTAAEQLSLTPGVELTAAQVAQLTSDIVWLVNQDVALPDGSVQTVLVPKVYVLAREGDLSPTGSLISANAIQMNSQGDILNQGTIAGRQVVDLKAQNIENNQGRITGQKVGLRAEDAIRFEGGSAVAKEQLVLQAHHVDLNSTTASSGDKTNGNTSLDRVAGLYVSDSQRGLLSVMAQNDINANGAVIVNNAQAGSTQLVSQSGSVNLGTVDIERHESYGERSDKNHWINHQSSEVGSQIQAKGNVTLLANEQVNIRQGSISSEAGAITLQAGHGVNIVEGRNQEDFSQSVTSKSSGMLSKTKNLDQYSHTTDQSVASTLSGHTVAITSGQDITVQGSDIVSDKGTVLAAKNNVTIEAAQNHYTSQEFHEEKKSGLMGSGGIGFTIGSKKESTDEANHSLTHRASTVGSLEGDTLIAAGQAYTQTGSTVAAPEGNVTIVGQQVDIQAAENTYASDFVRKFSQKGLTVSVNVPVVNAVQGAVNTVDSVQKVGQSNDARVNAMAATNAGISAYKSANALTDVAANPSGAVKQDVSVSITYGQQKSQSETHLQNTQAAASEVLAGGKTKIVATGAGEKSNIHIIGSEVAGLQGTHLYADNQINIGAFEEMGSERSSNKSSGFNAGVAVTVGKGKPAFGVTAGANKGKGHGNGDDVSYHASHVGSSQSQTTLQSAGATNIVGAQVLGRGVQVQAAELNIESLQDTSRYDSKQKDMSGQVTIGYGASGSASYSQSKIKADYAAVAEQSGIMAGDDGFQIQVAGNTDLKGAIITSTQAAQAAGKNSLTTGTLSHSDLHNHADYKGSSFGISGGGSIGGGEARQELGGQKLMPLGNNQVETELGTEKQTTVGSIDGHKSIGFGHDSGHQTSTTHSGINTGNITITDEAAQWAKTGQSAQEIVAGIQTEVTTDTYIENAGYLANNFDKEKVQKELDLQRKVTQEFDQNRQEIKKELYQRVASQRKEAEEIRKSNGGYDTEESKRLDAQAASLYETTRWVDMGLGAVWGGADAGALLGVYTGTQADRAKMSHSAPKEMWYQTCDSAGANCQSRQIWSLEDLTPEERLRIQDDGNTLTISNPGILNDRDAALRNAALQNKGHTNEKGILVVMNPPTGNYEGYMIFSTLVPELMYAGYDKFNDITGATLLPLSNSQKLNQELYLQAQNENWMVDTSNHSRGGLTAHVSLQNLQNEHQIYNLPLHEARFFGTATNTESFANTLDKNGFVYKDADGNEYKSGTYSAVHQADFVGRPFFVGNNPSTGGACWFCYSHSSYYADVPSRYLMNGQGQFIDERGSVLPEGQKAVESYFYKDYEKKWGDPTDGVNRSSPKLVLPREGNKDDYKPNPY